MRQPRTNAEQLYTGTHDDYRTLLTAIEDGVNINFAMTYTLAR